MRSGRKRGGTIRVWLSVVLILIILAIGPAISSANDETIPVATISRHPSIINESQIALFSAKGSYDPDGQIIYYYWDFGDGIAGIGREVNHSYSDPGVYITTLKVTDDRGLHSIDMVETIVLSSIKHTTDPEINETNHPPIAHIKVYPNPATAEDIVTFECIGEDIDGEVVVCVSIFPDGEIRSVNGEMDYFKEKNATSGLYLFKVKDGAGEWSEEVGIELVVTPMITTIPWLWVSIAILLTAIPSTLFATSYASNRNRYGSIQVSSDPYGAKVFLDKVPARCDSPTMLQKIPIGNHVIEVVKLGYYVGREDVMVIANQTSNIHIDLVDIPNIRINMIPDPLKIKADGASKSIINIGIEAEDDSKKIIPIIVPETVEVILETDLGTIESPVRIHAGSSFATSVLISSEVSGTANVTAKVDIEDRFKLSGTVKVHFID
ncbi:MAG: PKD domain-containing protein [Halobacteriota archaeon]|nr:PKD domain-containing protein [Halobacteriota archaeon]